MREVYQGSIPVKAKGNKRDNQTDKFGEAWASLEGSSGVPPTPNRDVLSKVQMLGNLHPHSGLPHSVMRCRLSRKVCDIG